MEEKRGKGLEKKKKEEEFREKEVIKEMGDEGEQELDRE